MTPNKLGIKEKLNSSTCRGKFNGSIFPVSRDLRQRVLRSAGSGVLLFNTLEEGGLQCLPDPTTSGPRMCSNTP